MTEQPLATELTCSKFVLLSDFSRKEHVEAILVHLAVPSRAACKDDFVLLRF